MKISIYQINLEKDTEKVAFLGLDQLKRLYGKAAINGSIYEEVFYGVVDLLPDRQSFTTHPSVDKDEKAEFVAWLDKQALPYLNLRLKERNTAHVEFASRDDRYFCVAEDRSSGGYLYIGAYTRQ